MTAGRSGPCPATQEIMLTPEAGPHPIELRHTPGNRKPQATRAPGPAVGDRYAKPASQLRAASARRRPMTAQNVPLWATGLGNESVRTGARNGGYGATTGSTPRARVTRRACPAFLRDRGICLHASSPAGSRPDPLQAGTSSYALAPARRAVTIHPAHPVLTGMGCGRHAYRRDCGRPGRTRPGWRCRQAPGAPALCPRGSATTSAMRWAP